MKFIHNSGKHNKFWSYEIDQDYNVNVSWGRLGTKGRTKIYSFDSIHAAKRFAEKKAQEKLRKGYQQVDIEDFGLKQLEAKLVGSGCKVEELVFIKPIEELCWSQWFFTIEEKSALADPNYEPLIYCRLRQTGLRGCKYLLISENKVYSCLQVGLAKWHQGCYKYRLEDIQEIDDNADKELLRVRELAPALVHVLMNKNAHKLANHVMPW